MPMISVVVPAYNRQHLIVECLKSIAQQTFEDWDVWVVDDGSTDHTLDVVHSLGLPHLHVMQIEHGRQAKARNAALALINSQFVAFLDSDDIWKPDKLEKQIRLFTDRPQVGLVCSDAFRLEGQGVLPLTTHQLRPPRRGRVFETLCLNPNFVVTSTVVMRRQCFEEIGLFEPAFVPSEDFHMWLRVAARYEFDYVPEPLVWYRFHAGQSLGEDVPGNYFRRIEALQAVERLYPDLTAPIAGPLHRSMAFQAYLAGREALAGGHYQRAKRAFALSMNFAWSWRAAVFSLFSLLFAQWREKSLCKDEDFLLQQCL